MEVEITRLFGLGLVIGMVYMWGGFFRWGWNHKERLDQIENAIAELPTALGVPALFGAVAICFASLIIFMIGVALLITGG